MAATITHTAVAGLLSPLSMGTLKVAVKDTRITSADANDAGDFVVTPEAVGLDVILAVIDFHVYAASAAADYPRSVDFVPATGTVTFYATDRGALDLDSTDYAQARLGYVGF